VISLTLQEDISMNAHVQPATDFEREERIAAALRAADPEKFQIGDIIEFEKADGWRWIVTILGGSARAYDLMAYDGRPHHFMGDAKFLDTLRITNVTRMDEEAIDMYRGLLGLDAASE
jgi:hypothetical protein